MYKSCSLDSSKGSEDCKWRQWKLKYQSMGNLDKHIYIKGLFVIYFPKMTVLMPFNLSIEKISRTILFDELTHYII